MELKNFRNLVFVELTPDPDGLTVIRGDNGTGKTSLLEAIVYAGTQRSFRGVVKEALVHTGALAASITCELEVDRRQVEVICELVPGRRDRIVVNGQRVTRSAELAEVLRTTLFTPDDLSLVKGAPGPRRDLLDEVLAVSYPLLGADRVEFDRILRQRNALLRQLSGRLDSEAAGTLEVWDERLGIVGDRLVQSRQRLVGELGKPVAEAFSRLAPRAGPLRLSYERSFTEPLAEVLAAARSEDLRREMTTVGPQRDDVLFEAGGLDARTRLSQGRQRCVALAWRLGAHHLVAAVTSVAPALLLDDAFSELDIATTRALMSELPPGQALLTTAGPLPDGVSADLVVTLEGGTIAR